MTGDVCGYCGAPLPEDPDLVRNVSKTVAGRLVFEGRFCSDECADRHDGEWL